MSITYKELERGGISVYLDKRKVGEIKGSPEGWRYYPKGSTVGGELFGNLNDCLRSLEQS